MMKRFTGNAAGAQILRNAGVPIGYAGGSRRLGDYGDGNVNALPARDPYNERDVFRGVPTDGSTVQAPIEVIRNRNSFNILPFAFQLTDGSKQILPSNERRTFLFVQNQSTTDTMYFNFSNDAGVNLGIELYPAQGFVFDQVAPYNSVSILVNATQPEKGIVVEGAIQL